MEENPRACAKQTRKMITGEKMSKQYGLKRFKQDMAKPIKGTQGGFLIFAGFLALLFIGSLIYVSEEQFNKGYTDALKDNMKQQNYETFLSYDFDTRKEAFWTTIMWEVGNSSGTILMMLGLIGVLWAVFH